MPEPKRGDRVEDSSGKPITNWIPCRCGRGELRLFERAVFHTLPYCDQFLELEPSIYVRWVRIGEQALAN